MKRYLAIDIGASSGRHIVGWEKDGQIETEEIYRFPNGIHEEKGHFVWDTEHLLNEVKKGITCAQEKYPDLYSLAIDTWGVDYVLLKDGKEVLPVYAYRDHRTESVIEQVHERIPFSSLYRRTGCQFQPFNSIYQLYADKISGRLEGATNLLMIPEYLLYKLCKTKAREYTNGTTTGMVNAITGEYDEQILKALDYPKHLFPKLTKPGKEIGEYMGIKCILCATHDTASAVHGIPMDENEPYISSGTWSLLGVKTPCPITDEASEKANYSNEGGIGYNRYQKNIMGMWIINELKKELANEMSYSEMIESARKSDCSLFIDVNTPDFLAPKSMKEAFDQASKNRLHSIGDYFSCAFHSLAESYAMAVRQLENNTGRIYKKIYIVGGGAKNHFLNQLTEKSTGKEVIALPIEATVLGNLKLQIERGNKYEL